MWKQVMQVAGFLATCVGLYAWVTAPQERPQAEVYFADFEEPPSLAQQLQALGPLTSLDDSRGQFFKPSLRHKILPDTSGTVDQVLGSVGSFVTDKVPVLQHRNDYAFKGYWRVRVRNPGSRTASAVSLRFPVTASGVVASSRGKKVSIQELPVVITDVFALGNVQPADEVVVYAWTLSPASEDLAKKITLTHDTGQGQVQVKR